MKLCPHKDRYIWSKKTNLKCDECGYLIDPKKATKEQRQAVIGVVLGTT